MYNLLKYAPKCRIFICNKECANVNEKSKVRFETCVHVLHFKTPQKKS